MGRCCDGRNAYTPITYTRYLLGILLFFLFHLQGKILLFLRHIFIKRYDNYQKLSEFHNRYFKDTLKEIKEKKGMKVLSTARSGRHILQLVILFLACLFILLNYLFRFEGPVKGYWDTYIAVPAALITNQPVTFTSKEGEKLYSYSLPGKLPENLVNNQTYGISSKDQRLGSAIFFAPWFLLFKLFGFRLLFALLASVIGLFVFLASRLLTKNFTISVFCACCATLNSYILSINSLNPNLLGIAIISLLLYLLIRENPGGFVIGLIYGVLGGIRNEAILFLPAIIYKLFVSSDKKNKEIILFIIGTAITITPILYWNYFAFGNPLMHPTQFRGLDGFRPEFAHRFLFWKFNFNGLLNYPFHNQVVRTPYFSFPVFLLLPLIILSSFGLILSSLIFTGALQAHKKHPQAFIFLILWLAPMYLLLSVAENWSDLKTTFILMWFNPIVLFIGLGIKELFLEEHKRKTILKIVLLSVILFAGVKILSLYEFAVDQRWYSRFPRAVKGTEFSYIGDDLRTKFEDPAELAAQKKVLTRGNLLPEFKKIEINIPNTLKTIKKEISTTDITTVDFWKYIYEK